MDPFSTRMDLSKMKGRPTEGRSILFNIGKVHPFQYRKGPPFKYITIHLNSFDQYNPLKHPPNVEYQSLNPVQF